MTGAVATVMARQARPCWALALQRRLKGSRAFFLDMSVQQFRHVRRSDASEFSGGVGVHADARLGVSHALINTTRLTPVLQVLQKFARFGTFNPVFGLVNQPLHLVREPEVLRTSTFAESRKARYQFCIRFSCQSLGNDTR